MVQHLSDFEVPGLVAGLVDIDGSYVFLLGLFLVFFAALHAIIIKPMMKAHELRYSRMKGARQDAEAMDLKAAEAAEAYDAKLDDARQDAVKVRDELRVAGETEARKNLSDARQRVSDKLAEGSNQRDAALKAADAELEQRASELADDIVQRLLGKAAGGKA